MPPETPINPPTSSLEIPAGNLNTSQNQLSPSGDLESYRRHKYNTRWKQQRNLAFRQEFTFFRVLVLFLILGVLFLLLALLCYLSAASYPTEVRSDYTNCKDKNSNPCYIKLNNAEPCKCSINITINDDSLIKSDKIMLYYELFNFHQNSRRYKKDADWKQLRGVVFKPDSDTPIIPKKCTVPDEKKEEKPIYPCGKIANSYFSDRIQMFDASSGSEMKLDSSGITWDVDRSRFKRPKKWKDVQNHFDPPPAWSEEFREEFFNGSGVEDEHFIIWMRAASLHQFRKKYGFVKGLKKGTYRIDIDYRFEMKSFYGTKTIVIAALPGSLPVNMFFSIGFLIVGAICLLLGPLFYFIEIIIKKIRKRKEEKELLESVKAPASIQGSTTEVDEDASNVIEKQSPNNTPAPPARGSKVKHPH